MAREYTVRYFRTIGIKYRLAKRYIPEELDYAICDAYSLQSLIDAPKGTMFYALPERDPLWCVDEVYPPLKRLPRYGTLPAEAIQLINELYAAGKSEEARHVLEARAEANHVSQAGLRAPGASHARRLSKRSFSAGNNTRTMKNCHLGEKWH